MFGGMYPQNLTFIFIAFVSVVAFNVVPVQSEVNYYCPYGEKLIYKKCYQFHRNSEIFENAENICSQRSLPKQQYKEITGWLSKDNISTNMFKEHYCLYAKPLPKTVTSSKSYGFKFDLGPCQKKIHYLCEKRGAKSCSGDNFFEVTTVSDNKTRCLAISDSVTSGGTGLNIASSCQTIFDFSWTAKSTEIELTSTVKTNDLTRSFWIPWYLDNDSGKLVTVQGTSEDLTFDVNQYCYFKLAGKDDVHISDCARHLPFYCESDAVKIQPKKYDNSDFVPDKDETYICDNKDDIQCNGRCYRHRNIYMTQEEADRNCTGSGYELVSHDVSSCLGHRHGWIKGSLESGTLKRNDTNLTLGDICVYVYGGYLYIGDCSRTSKVLCQYDLKDYNLDCPSGYTKCDYPDKMCVGESTDSFSWSDALDRSVCASKAFHVGAAKMVDNRLAMGACQTIITNMTSAHGLWIGAKMNKNMELSYINGEKLNLKKLKGKDACLSVFGGKLRTADCTDNKYFTCEKLATVMSRKDEVKKKSNTTLVMAILIAAPIILVLIVLMLVYRKKGSDMCLGNATVENEELQTGTVIMNTYSETVTIKEEDDTA